jgi:hypothetical protein
VDVPVLSGSNQMVLGNSTLLYGDLLNNRIGIGSTAPSNKLHLVATTNPLRLEGLVTSSQSDVLVVDATGVVTKRTGSFGSGWLLTGNSGTVSGTSFIGTTDAQDMDIRTNNVIRARITQKGQIETLNTGSSVFVGEQAGKNDDLSANENVFIGYKSGYSNTTGYDNTANGMNALFTNTTGSYNVANGVGALYSNSTGVENVAIGSLALYFNTYGFDNVANGFQSLYKNTTGSDNTANGMYSLYSNTTGHENTANGFSALYYNTTGLNNIANGEYALYSNTSGYDNTATGNQALYLNSIGNHNAAFGYNTMYYNTIGYQNTAHGDYALFSNTTGANNIGIGYLSGQNITSGSNNIVVGNNVNVPSATGNNQMVLGNSETLYGDLANNRIGIGSTSPTNKLHVVATADPLRLEGLQTSTQNDFLVVDASGVVTKRSGGLSAGLIGSGTATQLAFWDGTSSLSSNSNLFWDNTNNSLGIGSTFPTNKLHVVAAADPLRLEGLQTSTLSDFLVVDGNGVVTKRSGMSGSGWSLTGNGGTVSGTNFIGTTDAQPLMMKVNNQKAGYIDYLGSLRNTGFGYESLNSNSGIRNSAFGDMALSSNTVGGNNTAIGALALSSNTTGERNVANGAFALYSNTAGQSNTATGESALESNVEGFNNTSIGASSLASNTIGYENTAVGESALSNTTTGNHNTSIGSQAGLTNTTGQSNTYIGYDADGSSSLTNATAIGANALVTQSNSLVLGNNVNVGIGIASPANLLHIHNASLPTLQFTNSVTGTASSDGGTIFQSGFNFYFDNGESGNIIFSNVGVPWMSITPYGGNVGIGTTTPPLCQLDIAGNVRLNNNILLLRDGNDYSHGIKYDATIDGPYIFGFNGGALGSAGMPNALEWSNTGNVAVKGNFSAAKFVIVDASGANNGTFNSGLQFAPNSGEGIGSNRSNSANQFGMDFYTNGNKNMSITNGGFVGIGTSVPPAQFTVYGNGNYNGQHVALFENTNNSGSGGDGIAVKIDNQVRLNAGNNFVTFYDGSNNVKGRIEGFNLVTDYWTPPAISIPNLTINYVWGSGSFPVYTDGTWPTFSVDPPNAGINLTYSDWCAPSTGVCVPNGGTVDIGAFNPSVSGGSWGNLSGGSQPVFSINTDSPISVNNPSHALAQTLACAAMENGFDALIALDPISAANNSLKADVAQICKDGGVTYGSHGADYAEYIEKTDHEEFVQVFDVVGIKGGKASRNTDGAEQIMVVSGKPVVLGNTPKEADEKNYVTCGFMGQLPCVVRGICHKGDYVLASGLNDGTAIAVSPESIQPEQVDKIVGRAWEEQTSKIYGLINVAIGLKTNEWLEIYKRQATKVDSLQTQIDGLSAQIEILKTAIGYKDDKQATGFIASIRK